MANWKEVEQIGVWKPEEKGDEIEGQLKSVDTNVGSNNSNMYHIETNDGIIGVWGSVVLDSRLSTVALGSQVKLVFQGLGEKKGGKNAPKLFKVYVDATFEDGPRDDDGHPVAPRDESGHPITDEEIP